MNEVFLRGPNPMTAQQGTILIALLTEILLLQAKALEADHPEVTSALQQRLRAMGIV